MQYLTSKTSLLTFVIILALLLFYLWFKYNIGLTSLMQQRAAWESRYDELLQDFEGYTAKVRISYVFDCSGIQANQITVFLNCFCLCVEV